MGTVVVVVFFQSKKQNINAIIHIIKDRNPTTKLNSYSLFWVRVLLFQLNMFLIIILKIKKLKKEEGSEANKG